MTTTLGDPVRTASDGPYVGPRPFDPAERGLFFGRAHEAQTLASLIVAHRVVLLYATSGAGKTSLLNAGVIPLLVEQDSFEVFPTARLLGVATSDAPQNPWIANLIANLAPGTPSAGTLAEFLATREPRLVEDGLRAPRALIIDQFEELFTLYPEQWPKRRDVFLQIGEALAADPLLRVVLALREDYVAQLDPFADLLPTKLRTRMRLESLRRTAALEAVNGPLRAQERTFAPGTAERLVDDLLRVRVHARGGEQRDDLLGETVEPVQLQVVCRTLWASLPPEVQEISESDLERIGSVSNVLSEYYREAVHAAALAGGLGERELRDRLEAAFITPVGTRGTVVGGDTETAGIPNVTIAEFEARHLVRAEWRAGARWYELTHDSLIGPIVASNDVARRSHEARRVRRLQRAIAALGVLAAVLVGAVLLLTRDAERTAPARPSVRVLQADGAFEKLQLKHTLRASDEPIGMELLANGRGLALATADGRIRIWDMNLGEEIDTLDYRDDGLASLDVDGGGREILVTGSQGLRTWTTEGLGRRLPDEVVVQPIDEATEADGAITAAAFDDDGAWLITVQRGRASLTGRYMDVASQPPFSLPVARVAFSSTGTTVAGVTPRGGVVLRDVVSGLDGAQPVGPERRLPAAGTIVAASFSADGETLVTASRDGAARLWRARDGSLLRTLRGDGAALTAAQLSADGRYIATAAQNGLARVFTVWGRPLAVVRASNRSLSGIAFAAGGRLLVTADSDGVARVWSVVAPTQPLPDAHCVPSARVLASSTCLTRAGRTLRAPEAGVMREDGPRRVRLTAPDGRVWRFHPATATRRTGTVAAGTAIGTTVGTEIRIELWDDARGADRALSRWNPQLFLPTPPSLAYPGDNASPETIARWMGTIADRAGLPPELPVMAALVESGLKNLDYGNADAVGFFQMRKGIWNQGVYAGFPEWPELQLRWFIDNAVTVRRQQLAAGGDPVGDPARYGEWIADVERPAEAYRGRYQLKLNEARELLGLPPATPTVIPTVATATPDEGPPVAEASSPSAAAAPATDITPTSPCKPCPAGAAGHAAEAALTVQGKPSPATGDDADGSGLVYWAFDRADAGVPEAVYDQAQAGTPVARADLERGDIVLFANREGEIYHVGLYLQDDRFVHATKQSVVVESLDAEPWAQRFSAGRRIR